MIRFLRFLKPSKSPQNELQTQLIRYDASADIDTSNDAYCKRALNSFGIVVFQPLSGFFSFPIVVKNYKIKKSCGTQKGNGQD